MAWLDTGSGPWAKRKVFFLPNTKAASAENDIPLNVKISASAGTNAHDLSPIFDEVGASNLKIAITTSDGTTQCYVEIDQWDEIGEVANLFFKAPSVSDSSDTIFYLYYDSTEADNTTYVGVIGSAAAETVWPAVYKGVYHMAQDPTGGAGCILDSTSNDNDGTPQGGMTVGDLVAGQMGKGLYFDGTEYISLGDILDIDSTIDLTIEALLKSDGVHGGETHIIGKREGAPNYVGYGFRSGPSLVRLTIDNDATGQSVTTGNIDDSAYHSLSVSSDRDIGTRILIDQDGIVAGNLADSTDGSAANALNLLIGGNNGVGTFKGTIDEIRIVHGTSSDGWKALQHYSHDDDLFTWGVHEALGGIDGIGAVSGTAKATYSGAGNITAVGALAGTMVATYGAAGNIAAVALLSATPFRPDFGVSVLGPRAGASPGMFAMFKDHLLYADGAGRAQIYTGQNAPIYAFNVYKGTAAIPTIPEEGADYTQEVSDGLSTTFADMGSLGKLADNHCLFVIIEVPIDKLNLAFSAWNSTDVGSLSLKYWNGTALTTVSGLSNSTNGDGAGGAGSISFGKDGTLKWDLPTDEVPYYAFGRSGFIYQISHSHASATFDSAVELTSLTCEYTGGFQDIQNVWDGILLEAIEARVHTATDDTYAIYSSQAVRPGDLDTADHIYFNSLGPVFGVYLDILLTPNTTANTLLDLMETWTGAGWTSVGASLDDGSAGGSKSGYATWNRSVTPKKLNFNGSRYHSYWYRMSFNKVLSSTLTWSIFTMPYFNIDDIYPTVQSLIAWDRRMWYCFNDNMLYGTAQNNATGLNGDDRVEVPIGDHRANKNICMRKFYNFCLVWQEEKGSEGGGFHLLQPGGTAAGYAAQIISPTIGIMNSKCAVVLEGATMADMNTQRPFMTGAYFVSRLGVYKSDGSFLKNISGGIGNYFDPEKAECIRAGYEDKHFLGLDSANGVLLLGIVSGSTATQPNKFFVLDPLTDSWVEDKWGYDISCVAEVGAASGNIPVVQLAGCQDGFVRRINTGNLDDGLTITSNIVLEIDGNGRRLIWMDEAFRCKAQALGKIVRTVAISSNDNYDDKKVKRVWSMEAAKSGNSYRRYRKRPGDIEGDHLSIKYENSTRDTPAGYIDVGIALDEVDE